MTTTADTPDVPGTSGAPRAPDTAEVPFSGIAPAADADPHLRELPLSAQWVLRGNFLQVSRDRVQLPNGRETTREYIHHPGAAVIVPILEDGRLLLERQYRYPMGRVMLEFPAGKLDPDESPLVCAQRELLEETGYRATEWAHAGVMHNAIAYSTERIEIFFARGLVAGERKLDDGEFLDVVAHDQDTLERMAIQGELTDAKSLTCLLWLSRWRAGAWPLDWHPAA